MEAAQVLLNPRAGDELKTTVCSQWKSNADQVLKILVAKLPNGDTEEEYRCIPWIWKLSIEATRNEEKSPGMILKLLELSTPAIDEPLRDWQAVVIGGAVINGLSLNGLWPEVELKRILQNDLQTKLRFDSALTAPICSSSSVLGFRNDWIQGIDSSTGRRATIRMAS